MDLLQLSRALAQTHQGDVSLRDETASALRQFIADPTDIRSGVMCAVDAIRVFAPEPPIEENDIPKVFRLLMKQLWLLHEPTETSFVWRLMEKLSKVDGYLLILTARECILDEIFATIFEVYSTPFDISSVPHLTRALVKMMIGLLNNAGTIPTALLYRMFRHVVQVGELRILVKSVLRGLKDSAVDQVDRFVQSELFSRHRASRRVTEDLFICVYEAYTINPELVRSALPNLTVELRAVDPVQRTAATDLVGKMASLTEVEFPTQHPQVWKAFLERFDDVSNTVRHACTKHVGAIIQNYPTAASTQSVLDRCSARLLDRSKVVRLSMVSCVSDIARNPLYIESVKRLLPRLFQRCRDKHRDVSNAALLGSIDIYMAHRGEEFVNEVPSHVFASVFLHRSEKVRGVEEECAERLFEPTSNGVPACVLAFRGQSGGLDELAQNGLIVFSQRKTFARQALLRLVAVREEILSEEPSRDASSALTHFTTFCPTVTEKALMRFLSCTQASFWASIQKWANVRTRLTVAQTRQLWEAIVSQLKRIRVQSALLHVIRLSGAHLFISPDDIPGVLDDTIVVNLLSIAAPYCFLWHIPQLCASEADDALRALQRVAKHAPSNGDGNGVGVVELPQASVDHLVTRICEGQVDAAACLVFAPNVSQVEALGHLSDVCVLSQEPAAKRPKCDDIGIVKRLKLATALASYRVHIDDVRDKFQALALHYVADYSEQSWSLLSELGCLRELMNFRDDHRVLPMLINAMAKDGVSITARDAIALMDIMVRHPDRHQFLGDINLLLWKTNWRPTFALVLILSVFALKSDEHDKIRRAEALGLLVLLLQNIRDGELPNIIIGFIAALAQVVPEKLQMDLIAAFLAQAYVDAKKSGRIALEACKRAEEKQGLTFAASIVFEQLENALERKSVVLDVVQAE